MSPVNAQGAPDSLSPVTRGPLGHDDPAGAPGTVAPAGIDPDVKRPRPADPYAEQRAYDFARTLALRVG